MVVIMTLGHIMDRPLLHSPGLRLSDEMEFKLLKSKQYILYRNIVQDLIDA